MRVRPNTRSMWIALFFLPLLPGLTPGFGQETASTVSISASGSVNKAPDRAWLRFNIVAEEKEQSAALDAAASASQQLLAQLRNKGIEPQDLQTTSLSLQAKYEKRREGGREVRGPLVGYVAAKSVTVTLRDVSKVPAFVREFPVAGPLRIADIGFFSSATQEATAEALEKAVKEAQRSAGIVVNAAGRQLGDVSSISVSVFTPPEGPPRALQIRHQQGDNSVEDIYGARLLLEPGEQQFKQMVSMQWTLGK